MATNNENMNNARRNVDDMGVYVQSTLLSVAAKMSEALKGAVEEAFDGADASVLKSIGNDLTRSFKATAKYSDDLAQNTFKISKGLLSVKDIEKQRNDLALKRATLERKIELAIQSGVEYNEEDLINTKKSLDLQDQKLQKEKQILEEVEERTGGLGAIFERLSKNRFFGSLINGKEALIAMREQAAKTGNQLKIFGAGVGAVFKGIEKSTVILAAISAAAKVFTFFKDLAFGVSEQTAELARYLGTSMESARGLRQQFSIIAGNSNDTLNTMGRLVKATGQLASQFGFVRSYSDDILKSQIFLTERVKTTAEQASFLNLLFATTGRNAETATKEMNRMVISMQEADGVGVDLKTVVEDIANAGAETASYYGYSTNALTKAAIEARKLGLNLSQAKQVAGGLLDFESSIQSQLELSVLTQKNFNFGQAMALSATGDIAGATKEVMRQMSQLTIEQRKSPVILNAAAKAAGISTEELARQFALQTDINAQKKEYGRILSSEGITAARTFLIEKGIKQAEVKEITERISAGERFTQALDAAKEAFSNLVSGGLLDRLMSVLDQAVQFLERYFGVSAATRYAQEISTAQKYGTQEEKVVVESAEKEIARINKQRESILEQARKNQSPSARYFGAGSLNEDLFNSRQDLKVQALQEETVALLKQIRDKESDVNIDGKKASAAMDQVKTKRPPVFN